MRQRVVSQAWVFFLGLLFSFLTFSVAVFAEDEILTVAASAPGFKAESSYQSLGNGEIVNAFSGGLTVTHASSIGLPGNMGGEVRLTRVFNTANIADAYNVVGGLSRTAIQDRPIEPLGAGWHLGVGRIFTRRMGPEEYPRFYYFYQDESGAEHRLYDTYFQGAPPLKQVSWYVTNDGSYIRALFVRDVDLCDKGKWTLYFPDGSIREAGDRYANAFVPVVTWRTSPPYVTTYITNPWSNGWYVNKITDRAGNITSIKYRRFDPALHPVFPPETALASEVALAGGGGDRECPVFENGDPIGFAGAIDTITDAFNRQIKLSYGVEDTTIPGAAWLLREIQLLDAEGSTLRTEKYVYTTKVGSCRLGLETWPVLASVEDAEGLVIRYDYYDGDYVFPDSPPIPAKSGLPLLKIVHYPTGGVSSYDYRQHRTLFFSLITREVSISPESFPTFVVRTHTLEYKPEPSEKAQKLTWNWRRMPSRYPFLRALGYGNIPVQIVVTSDPLGKEEVRYFATAEWTDPNFIAPLVPPGTELLRTVRKPGAPPLDFAAIQNFYLCEYPNCPPDAGALNSYNIWQYVISWEQNEYEFGGGDAEKCHIYFQSLVQPIDPHGNARPKRVVQAEIASNAVQTNFSCGTLACDGTIGAKWVKETRFSSWNNYGRYRKSETRDLTPNGDPTVKMSWSTYELPPVAPSGSGNGYQTDRLVYNASGSAGVYRAASYTRDSITGLVKNQHWFVKPQTSITTPVADANDKFLVIAYTPQGNISKLTYSGGDSTATYAFNFTWSYGMVSQMSRDGSLYGAEFNLTIEAATGLTKTAMDPNGLITTYDYDALNRLTKITPPNDEYATYIAYPNDSATAGTAHDIFFYRGPEKALPTMMTGFSETGWLAGIDTGAAYQHYIFDDLGRLVKTRSIHPEGYLTETMTAYDPLGKPFFTSLPYNVKTPPPLGTLKWDINTPSGTLLPVDGDEFVSAIPMNPQAPLSPYGSATSNFADASWPTSGELEQLIAGPRELFDRTVWSFSPSGSKTKNTYDGLNNAVTLFGIKTGETVDLNAESTTWYHKDIWGRLSSVVPPEGTSAVYAYNGLDQLTSVNLSGQLRSFTYDALGRILTASNPENGTTTYLGYDCIGNLLAAQDANGTAGAYKLANEYDLLGRLLKTKKANATTGATIQVLLENTYDSLSGVNTEKSLGKLVKSISRQFRAEEGMQSQPTTVAQSFVYGGVNGRVSLATLTTKAGSLTGIETAYPTEISYDLYGQTLEVVPPTGGSIQNAYAHGAISGRGLQYRPVMSSLTYDAAGSLTGLKFEAGLSLSTKMDAFERPTGFSLQDATGMIQWGNGSYASEAAPYIYDGAGNIASIGAMGLDGFGAPRKDAFTYDSLSRLTKAVVNRIGQTSPHVYDYTYDDFGNLLGRTESTPTGYATLKAALTAQGVVSTSAEAYIKQVNFTAVPATTGGVTNNRLDSVIRAGGATGVAAASATYLYDLNGNLIEDDNNVYAYDALNRQTAVYLRDTSKADHKGALLSQAFYDAGGERAARVTYDSYGAYQFTAYTRDGAAVLWEQTSTRNNAPPRSDKTYLYAAGKMAYTQTMVQPAYTGSYYKILSGGGAALGEPELSLEDRSQVAQAAYTVYNLSADITAFEVRVARVQMNGGNHSDGRGQDDGNSNSNSEENRVQTERVSQPAEGWGDGISTVRFDHLQPGWTYTVSFMVETTLGTIELFGATRLELETGSFTVPDTQTGPRCWARHHWERTGATQAEEELTVGWGGVASGSHAAYLVNMKVGTSQTALTPEPVTGNQVTVPVAALSIPEGAQSGSLVVTATAGSGTVQTAVPGGVTPNIPIFPTVRYIKEYYATDHLGTVRAVYDPSAATPLHTFDYEPFGIEITPNDVEDNTHRFTGHERDQETGNDYMHFRYFSASMGRHCAPDNFVLDGKWPQLWNLYAYVMNNPVCFLDPDGHLQRGAGGNLRMTIVGRTWAEHRSTTDLFRGHVVTLYADNGALIQAFSVAALPGANNSQAGQRVTEDGKKLISVFPDSRNGMYTNCHGYTFADGLYTIKNDQVAAILNGDGYQRVTGPARVGDVFIFKNAASEIVHSGLVSEVDQNGNVTKVTSEGGLDTGLTTTSVTPGSNTAIWDTTTVTTEVYRKPDPPAPTPPLPPTPAPAPAPTPSPNPNPLPAPDPQPSDLDPKPM